MAVWMRVVLLVLLMLTHDLLDSHISLTLALSVNLGTLPLPGVYKNEATPIFKVGCNGCNGRQFVK